MTLVLRCVTALTLLTCWAHGGGHPGVQIKRLVNGDAAQLARLLDLDVKRQSGETYSGYYSYFRTSQGKPVLHGSFAIKYEDTGTEDDITYARIIEYTGSFVRGRKAGPFVERLINDDGVDFFETWRVTLSYEATSVACRWGTFEGRIGHVMPETIYQEENPPTCTFAYFTERAWAKWSEAYEDSLKKESER